MDGISECRRHGVTVIAFVGSVFSPYYHFAGRKHPQNHVAINVALYSVEGHRWAMTERGSAALRRNARSFSVGPSSLHWDGHGLTIDFAEMSLPRPPAQWLARPIAGRIRLEPRMVNETAFDLDQKGRHFWRPIVPLASISVECDHYREGGWRGDGYLDTNNGVEPLERGFARWDWSRGKDAHGNGLIVYDAVMRDGCKRQLGLRFSKEGGMETFGLPPSGPLKRGFWGVRRSVPSDEGSIPHIEMEMEDSPFYTRALIANTVGGDRLSMVHETFDGRRLSNPVVRLMLPVRMPRRAKWPG